MAIVFPESTRLGGSLIGLGIKHKDGSEDFRWLDKPIHNRIVSGGLDFLLTFDGVGDKFYNGNGNNIDQDNPRKAVMAGDGKYGNAHRCGACHYLKIGTDGSPTQFTDTDLHATIG